VARALPLLAATALIALAGCQQRQGVPATPTSSPVPAPSLPAGVPSSYAGDVAPGDVPLTALIPRGTAASGSWYATTSEGDAIVVAYAAPGSQPFRAERGLVVWRRSDGDPPWRAVFGLQHPADAGVLSIQALATADVTGDGSPEALVFEATGGSGNCGTWRVIDLAAGRQVYAKSLCDAQIVPSSSPVGLTLRQAVFKPGDSHCCPSAMRTTVLTYAAGGRWTKVSSNVTETGG
jgi:hypothetical protein